MNPRDPSSVDDAIDLRGSDPDASRDGGREGDGPEDAAEAVDDVGVEDDLDGPDPDNPFSLGPVGDPQAAPPPADGTIRRRRDVGDTRPLGPGPLPGPIAGADGSLDLTHVQSGGDDIGPGFLSSRPKRMRAESVLVRLIATAGVIAVATAVGAVMAAAGAAGWVVALVVSALSVLLAALLWRSRRL